jgi:hypothetical protein
MPRSPSCLEYYQYFRGETVLEANTIVKEIDSEWLELIIEAKKMGMTIEEIREFLYHTH